MRWNWQQTNNLETKVLKTEHGLPDWFVIQQRGAGKGMVTVLRGPTPKPPKLIHQLLRIDGVSQVITGRIDGMAYLLVTVDDPAGWDRVKQETEMVILALIPQPKEDAK